MDIYQVPRGFLSDIIINLHHSLESEDPHTHVIEEETRLRRNN